MAQPANSSFRLANVLVCLLMAALSIAILMRSLPVYLARIAPDWALMINANQPDALVRVAEQKLTAALAEAEKLKAEPPKSPPTTAQATAQVTAHAAELAAAEKKLDADVRALITRASQFDPLNPQVPHLLADLAERVGDRTQAVQQLEATLQHTLHDSAAIYKLIVFNIEARDYVKATTYTELLLRINPNAFEVVLPVLIHLANTEAATDALTAMLARNPFGRTWFFMELPPKVADLRVPQTLLLGLQNTAHPPSNREIAQYLHHLLHQHQLYGLAYYTWLQFTPPEHFDNDNLVFNGGFQRPTTALPFDWQITAGSGVTAQILPKPDADGNQGLNVEFGSGRVEFGGAQETLVLSPGTYDFNIQYRGSLVGRRGLVWRLTCDKPAPPILETPVQIGRQATWSTIALTFTVPEAGCRGQTLALIHTARSASEQLLSGSIWYKHVQIKRRDDATAAAVAQ
jgi:tetratricopeptide (TPR) repeat protein